MRIIIETIMALGAAMLVALWSWDQHMNGRNLGIIPLLAAAAIVLLVISIREDARDE